jgi:hypothetical protein
MSGSCGSMLNIFFVCYEWFYTHTNVMCVSDTAPNSLRNPNVGPKMKQWKNKRVRAYSLVRSISKVGRHAGILRWD